MRFKRLLLLLFLSCYVLANAKTIHCNEQFKGIVLYDTKNGDATLSDSVITLELDVKNNMLTKMYAYLSIINPIINRIELNENDSLYFLGDKQTFKNRIFYHSNFVFPVLLEAGESRHYNLKLYPQAENLQFKISLLPENEFIKYSNHDNFFSGIFFGISFMFLLLLISFYVFSKSKFFIYYWFINVFQLLLFLYYSGIGFHRIWSFSNLMQQYLFLPFFVGYFFFHIWFIRYFFVLELQKSIYKKIFRILLLSGIFLSGIFIYVNYTVYHKRDIFSVLYTLFQFVLFFYFIIIVLLSYLSYHDSKQKQILWILTGISIHYLSWMFFLNNIYGSSPILNSINRWILLPGNQFISNISFILYILEILIISFFIVYNYHFLIRQNNLSYKRLSFLQKKHVGTFILGQENEREKITAIIDNELVYPIAQLEKSILDWEKNTAYQHKLLPIIHKEIKAVVRDIHHITENYVAPDLESMPLNNLILLACENIEQEMQLNFHSELQEDFQLSALANVQLYRIFQELSNNILKHAHASEVIIKCILSSDSLMITIKDNGVGFKEDAKFGLGLMNIQSRLETLNGSIAINANSSTPGTKTVLILPLKEIH